MRTFDRRVVDIGAGKDGRKGAGVVLLVVHLLT